MKPGPIKAREFGDQRIEALGQKPYVDFETDDGTIVRLPHPLRMDDAALDRYEKFQRGDGLDRKAVIGEDGDPVRDPQTHEIITRIVVPHQVNGKLTEPISVRIMRAVLGDADHKRLIKSGMTSAELYRLWEEMTDGPQG